LRLTRRYLVGFPAKLVAATSTMTFWIPEDQINPAVWISLYAAIPIVFNMFNVRRYGEIEFWLATIKVTAFVGIIISGLLLPLGASSATRLLGTDQNHVLVPCDDPVTDNCVSPPGFICMTSLNQNTNDIRLEAERIQRILDNWGLGSTCGILALLLSSSIRIYRDRNHRYNSKRGRTTKNHIAPCSPSNSQTNHLLLYRRCLRPWYQSFCKRPSTRLVCQ
jgi:hypothetical protein